MEAIGQLCLPMTGGAYALLAQKKRIPLTPIRARWREQRTFVAAGIPDPTTRAFEKHEK